MDDTHSPYASAQMVLETVGDVEDPARGAALMDLLTQFDTDRERRDAISEAIRQHLRSQREEDVPP